MSIGDVSANSDYWVLRANGQAGGDPVSWIAVGTSVQTVNTTSGYSASTWHHAAAVEASSTDRRVFIDGGSKATNTTACTVSSVDYTELGRRVRKSGAGTLDGRIAEAAIYNAALSDANIAELATGASPSMVRPDALVAYWPLLRDTDQDFVGTYDMSVGAGTPSIATHPPAVFYSIPKSLIRVAPVVGGLSIPVAVHHYRQEGFA
jgi:hypothetical protein